MFHIKRYVFPKVVLVVLLLLLPASSSQAIEPAVELKDELKDEARSDPARVVFLSDLFPESFSFTVLGDSGWGSDEQYAISDLMYAAEPDFIIHTGDVVYKTGRWERYEERFIEPYMKILSRGITFYPVPGNHDYYSKDGEAFFRYFSYLPGNYYMIETGLVDFFALDTNKLIAGDPEQAKVQVEWLKKRLKKSDAPYKVVYMHHPFFTSGDHGSDDYIKPLEATLRPVFEEHGVHLVLTGHDHDYEHLGPVGGVTYIVTGGGGKDLRARGKVGSPYSRLFKSAYHFLKVKVAARGLNVTVIGLGGEVIENFIIRGAVP